jgi:ferritin-like metal-binding protein YciE
MIRAIPTPTPVIDSGVRFSYQKLGLARSREIRPSGGSPVQSSSSQPLMDKLYPPTVVGIHTGAIGYRTDMADPNTRDLKLIQYLTEAHGKEQELVTALQAHIAMTTRPPYKKRLQQHLKETKAHARATQRRVKQLGGKVDKLPEPVATAAEAVTSVPSKAMSAAKGPLHAIRGTGEHEKMLKNAKTEFSEEHEEIAMYAGIEALAEAVGDRDTAKLAREIRRDEERMANFLGRQIATLAKGVAREEIPAAERRTNRSPRRRSGSSRSPGTASRSRSASRAARPV